MTDSLLTNYPLLLPGLEYYLANIEPLKSQTATKVAERDGEKEFLDNYDPLKYHKNADSVVFTADTVLFKVSAESCPEILLIKRSNHPYKGFWCLPGGFVDEGEEPAVSAKRELLEETGIDNQIPLFKVGNYDTPWRDPRMRNIITFAYYAVTRDNVNVIAGDDAAEAQFFPLSEVASGQVQLGFDHLQVVTDTIKLILANAK